MPRQAETETAGPRWHEVLACLRIARGWKAQELAKAAGLKAPTLRAFERGEWLRSASPAEMVAQLAGVMGLPTAVMDRAVFFVEGMHASYRGATPATAEADLATLVSDLAFWIEGAVSAGLSRTAAGPGPGRGAALDGEAGGPQPRRAAGATAAWAGRALMMLRLLRGVPQTELARLTGIDRDLISRYECGKSLPRPQALSRLVEGMGATAAMLDQTLAFLEIVREGAAARESHSASLDLAREIDRLAAAERQAMEGFLRSRLERLRIAAHILASRRAAPALWARFETLTEAEQDVLVEAEPLLQTAGFCERLCDESVRAAGDSVDRALHLAELAVRVARAAAQQPALTSRLEGLALAHLANAVRVATDLPRADRILAQAKDLWAAGEGLDAGLLNEARVLQIESSLRRAQRRLSEALGLLDRALAINHWGETASLLIGRARTLEELGDFEAAIEQLRDAGSRIDGERDPELRFWVQKNLAVNLCHLGRHADAKLMLPLIRSMSLRLGKRLELVRVQWLEGLVAAGLGDPYEAVAMLDSVRCQFVERQMDYDAALVTLELAEVHAMVGRTAEVKALTRKSIPVFTAQGVHQEARKALSFFMAAVEAETFSVGLVREVIRYLYRARFEPDRRFEDVAVGRVAGRTTAPE
jgi:transcriptional regulator with XRE-family HTH domain